MILWELQLKSIIGILWEDKKLFDNGFLAMPLVSNVPEGKKDWEIVKCPMCGCDCWKRPLPDNLKNFEMKSVCTLCALKNGGK